MYFLRVFSKVTDTILPSDIAGADGYSVTVDSGIARNWQELVFSTVTETRAILLERSIVAESDESRQELDEFIDELNNASSPEAKWVADYIANTATVYTFEVASHQHLKAAQQIQTELWLKVSGMLQSDSEGFRDELGYLVFLTALDIAGVHRVALLHAQRWVRFSIDLTNDLHRRSFLDRKVPSGVSVHAIG